MATIAPSVPRRRSLVPVRPVAPTNRDATSDVKGGILLAVVSAATFAASGPFAKALLEAGWSTGAALFVRIAGGALILAPSTVIGLRRSGLTWPEARLMLGYGIIAVAGAQAAFFNAVQYLPVGVALLLEYLAPMLLVGFAWVTTRQAPGIRTLTGAILSMIGLVLVLNLSGTTSVPLLGVAWGVLAAVCLSAYFVFSSRPLTGISPLTLAGGGLAVGALTILALSVVGVLPFRASTDPVVLLGSQVSWIVPVAVLIVVASVIAYATGIVAAGRLGTRLASFVGLTEVLFSVLFAWLLLGELPVGVQLLGGLCILAGVTLVKSDRPAA